MKVCLYCGNKMVQRYGEAESKYTIRRYCTSRCKEFAQIIPKPTPAKSFLNKRCLCCDERLHASKHSSANEREKRDKKKIFCGSVCAAIWKKSQKTESGLSAMDRFLYGRVA